MLISTVVIAAAIATAPAHVGTVPAPLHLTIPEAKRVVAAMSRITFETFTESRLRVRTAGCHHKGPVQVVCSAAVKGDRIQATFRVRVHRIRPVYRIVMGQLELA